MKMGKVIALVNQKGGVSKTISTINIGGGLARKGNRVLLIDFDSQGSLSLACGVKSYELSKTIYEVLNGDCSARDSIVKSKNFDIIPSDLRLAKSEMELISRMEREKILKKAIDPIKNDYDFILIDCSPSLGILTYNALTSCDFVLIPTLSDYLSLMGINQLFFTINSIKQSLNPSITIAGIFISMFDSRTNISNDIVAMMEERFKDLLFRTKIRKNVSLTEATTIGQDIFEYDSNSNGANDYSNLIDEIMSRI